MKNILEAKNITKIYDGDVALDSVSIDIELGKIHAIIGENGAGKSTLIKCLTGVIDPDKGEILISGKSTLHNKKLFKNIAYVPQEIDLFNNMSVAENLFIPYEKSGISGIVKQNELEQKAKPILKKFNIDVEADVLVKDITISQKQLLQIARATENKDYDVLFLDEPTTSLTTDDTNLLFNIINEIKKENKAIIFISHKLEEIFAISDDVSVFRNGLKIACNKISNVDVQWVISKMTGKKIDVDLRFYSNNVLNEIVLEVNNLVGEKFKNISFSLRKGEILGFSGLVGAGRTEIMQSIFGYLPVYSGSVVFNGKNLKFGDTGYSVSNGLIYLPEERKEQGILSRLSVRENISVSFLKFITNKFGVINKKESSLSKEIVETYSIKISNLETEIRFLSGGNQQKVIIGRSMYSLPKVLIFDEPTKGVDIGTKTEIYKLMKNLAEKEGVGIILISSEMEEIIKCSNRIITLYKGRITAELENNSAKEDILSAIIGIDI